MEYTEKLNKLVEFLEVKRFGRNSLCCAAMDELEDEAIEKLLKTYNGNYFTDVRNAESVYKYTNAFVTGEKEYVSGFVKVTVVEYDFCRFAVLKVIVEDQERAFMLMAFPDDFAAIIVLQNQMVFSKKMVENAIECLKSQPFADNKILYVGN